MTSLDELYSYLDEEDGMTGEISDYLNYSPQGMERNVSFTNIFATNIRSLNANFDQFVCCMDGFKTDFHVLILTETWLSETRPFLYHIPGYTAINKSTSSNKCDGLCIYVREGLNFRDVTCHISEANSVSVDIELDKNKVLRIIGVYRSPNNNNIYTFLNSLSDCLDRIPNDMSVCLAGDINIDLHQTCPIVQEYINVLNSKGYKSYINGSTRVTLTTASCLDHIFFKNTKNTFNYQIGNILKTTLTDHFSVSLHLGNDRAPVPVSKVKNCNIIKKINYTLLKKHLEREDWSLLYNTNDCVDSLVSTFIGRLTEAISKCTYEKSIPHKKKPLKPWISEGIINSIITRDKMYHKLRKNPLNSNLKNDYKTYRNILNKVIRCVKSAYYQDRIEECKNNNLKLWKYINGLIGDGKSNGKDIKIDATTLNDFFVNVGVNQAQQINNNPRTDCFAYENLPNPLNSFYLSPTSASDVERIIGGLKNNCSPGTDNLSNATLKPIACLISKPLAFIFNKCFLSGKFPNHFKTAKIKPLFKNGDPINPGNYRPISLLSNLAKIMEKIIKKSLVSYLSTHNIINDSQFGFQANKSTEDALIKLSNTVSHNLNHNVKTIALFLDIRKAFDTIPHDLLFSKLERYGFRGVFLDLMKSYLQDRTQTLSINAQSCTRNLTSFGLPQGTVLSPILFILYVNDILNVKLRNATVLSFADDTAIVCTGRTWGEVHSAAEQNIAKVKSWLDRNMLSLNLDKTNYIAFSVSRVGGPADDLSLKLHSDCEHGGCACPKIQRVAKVKYLGVIIDQYLKWDAHIKFICKKMKYLSYKFYEINKILNIKHLRMVYYALVQSLLQYGITVWGGAFDSHLEEIFIMQKLIIKTILKKPRLYPTSLIFNEFNVLTVRQLYIKSVIKYINKYRGNFRYSSNALANYYSLRPTANKFQIYPSNCESLRKQLIYISTKIINEMPARFFNDNTKISCKLKREIHDWIKGCFFFALNL